MFAHLFLYNLKRWITSKIFLNFFTLKLESEMRGYGQKENLSFKIQLFMDNVTVHLLALEDLGRNITVVFYLSSLTLLISPMGWG